jgi:hypothetical protein
VRVSTLLLCARGYWLGRRTVFFASAPALGQDSLLLPRCWFAFGASDLHFTNHERPGDKFEVAGSAETAIADLAFLRCPVVCVPLFRCFPLAEPCNLHLLTGSAGLVD